MKDLATMTKGQINKALDKLDKLDSELCDRFIAAGRGHERACDILKATDPMALEYQALSSQRMALRYEIERRYGPGAPRRL